MKKTKAGRAFREEDLPAEASLLRYIESSALVAAILERDAGALAAIREIGQRATSALTLVETTRALIRARVAGRITPGEERAALRDFQWFVRACLVISISDQILERAGRPFPGEPVRTLDAIHLATFRSVEAGPLYTGDKRMLAAARSLELALVE